MTPRALFLAAAAFAGLSGCAPEKPFVLSDYRFHQRGIVLACYSEETNTIEDAKALADEVCRQYDRVASVQLVQPDQCSWRAPTYVILNCVPRPGENPGPILKHSAPMRHDTPLPPW